MIDKILFLAEAELNTTACRQLKQTAIHEVKELIRIETKNIYAIHSPFNFAFDLPNGFVRVFCRGLNLLNYGTTYFS